VILDDTDKIGPHTLCSCLNVCILAHVCLCVMMYVRPKNCCIYATASVLI